MRVCRYDRSPTDSAIDRVRRPSGSSNCWNCAAAPCSTSTTTAGCWWATTTPARSSCTRSTPDGNWHQLTDLGEPCQGRYLPGDRAVVRLGRHRRHRARPAVAAATGPAGRCRSRWCTIPAYIHTLLDVAARPGRLRHQPPQRGGLRRHRARPCSTGAERVLWDGGGYFAEAALSPDGRWVVLGPDDRAGRLLRAAAGRHRRRLGRSRSPTRRCPANGPTRAGCRTPRRCWPPPTPVPSSSRCAGSTSPTGAGRCWSSSRGQRVRLAGAGRQPAGGGDAPPTAPTGCGSTS